jgi:hypothetical protein
MSESGLGGAYWFSATQNGVNCRNVTYIERLGTTPFQKTHGVKKDVWKFRPFGCNLGFTTECNTSGYKLLIKGKGKMLISN